MQIEQIDKNKIILSNHLINFCQVLSHHLRFETFSGPNIFTLQSAHVCTAALSTQIPPHLLALTSLPRQGILAWASVLFFVFSLLTKF